MPFPSEMINFIFHFGGSHCNRKAVPATVLKHAPTWYRGCERIRELLLKLVIKSRFRFWNLHRSRQMACSAASWNSAFIRQSFKFSTTVSFYGVRAKSSHTKILLTIWGHFHSSCKVATCSGSSTMFRSRTIQELAWHKSQERLRKIKRMHERMLCIYSIPERSSWWSVS